MNDDQQTVTTNPDGTGAPNPDGTSGGAPGDDLDTLMSEFDSQTTTTPQAPEPSQGAQQPTGLDEAVAFIHELKAKQAQEDLNKGLGDAVQAIKTEVGDAHSDQVVEGLLHVFAKENPGVVKAFEERGKNPANWDRTVKALLPKVQEALGGRVDRNVSQDREAISAAVRGATTIAPETQAVTAEQIVNMDDKEFGKLLKDAGLG